MPIVYDNRFQTGVSELLVKLFPDGNGQELSTRVFRFIEEALELGQALGCTEEQANELVKYVFGRPVGEPHQELGGTMVTLAALAHVMPASMALAGWTELERCNQPEVIAKIQAKQASKPNPNGPLPGVA
jgi:hypothetical protein